MNWKDIKGYEGIYQVNEIGDVKKLHRIWTSGNGCIRETAEKLVPKFKNADGYYTVTLIKNNKSKGFKTHRLVAMAFIDNPENKLEVNHINGLKSDNSIKNLEWCTHKENMLHARENNLWLSSKKGGENPLSKKVIDTKTGKIYGCVQEAGNSIGVKRSTIGHWLTGKTSNKSNLKYYNENHAL